MRSQVRIKDTKEAKGRGFQEKRNKEGGAGRERWGRVGGGVVGQ
jgi:hypothetical protein